MEDEKKKEQAPVTNELPPDELESVSGGRGLDALITPLDLDVGTPTPLEMPMFDAINLRKPSADW